MTIFNIYREINLSHLFLIGVYGFNKMQKNLNKKQGNESRYLLCADNRRK